MTSDAKRDEIVAREEERRLGEEAKRFLESELVRSYLDNAERTVVDAAVSLNTDLANPNGDLARHRAMIAISVIRGLRKAMEKAVRDGAFSAKALEDLIKNG